MFTIHGLVLHNIVYFKNVKLALDKNPLTVVRGLNKDTTDMCQPTSNGAGKSLLFSCPSNIFYFSPPAATRKNSKKELLKKDSTNKIVFSTPSGDRYSITQSARGYVIKENGVDLEYRRIPEAEKFIRKIFPLLEIDYYTYCYVSTQRPYLLQSDSDTNRLDHLTAIFRLDSYDLMRSHFVKQLSSVKSNEVRLSVLEQRALEDRVKIKKLTVKQKQSINTNKTLLRETQKTLSHDLEKLNKKFSELEQSVLTLLTLKRIETELDTLRNRYTYKERPALMYKELVAERKVLRELDKYEDALAVYTKTISSLTKKLDLLEKPNLSKKKLRILLEKQESLIESEYSNLESLEEIESKYKRQRRIVEKLQEEYVALDIPDGTDLTVDWGAELAQCMATLKLSNLLDHEHLDKKKNACPVCLSKIDLDNIKQAVSSAKKRLPKLKRFTLARNLTKQIWDESLKLERQDITSLEDEILASKSIIETATNQRLLYKQDLKTIAAIEDLQEQLNEVTKPKRVKQQPTLNVGIDVIDEHIELCSDILKHLEAKSRLLENHPSLAECRTVTAVDKEIRIKEKLVISMSKKVSETRKELSRVSDDLEQASLLESELEITTRNLNSLEKEILTLKPSVEDKAILETLVKAYSTKGLKTLVANEVCGLLETNLNHYRDLTFAEPFSFSVQASESGLSILVDRNNGKISDVRMLSGAESDSFRMLFLISILVLVPSERRLNMVVLDEPSSHMSVVSRQIIYYKYLPALQEVVQNIYIIDNTGDAIPKGIKIITIKKENGESTIL